MDDPRCTLILFDMDGTLVMLAPTYEQAYREAIPAVYGLALDPSKGAGNYSGNTQPNILRDMCRRLGLPEATIEDRLVEAVDALTAAFVRLLPMDLRPNMLPGVLPLLETLRLRQQPLALVSGTVSPAVQTVLERTGLQDYFPVRVGGEEGSERIELLRLAVARAQQAYGWRPGKHGLVVVGDAPRDVQAGKALGARTVAVATGFHDQQALAQCEPDVVLPDLADQQRALAAILQGPTQTT